MNVFPKGPGCSLRGVLLAWLLPLFALVAALAGAASWWSYSTMVNTFMDDQMSMLGNSLMVRNTQHEKVEELSVHLPVLTRERVREWGTYAVQVYDGQGHLKLSNYPAHVLPLQASPGFHDVEAGGEKWRVYLAVSPDATGRRVQVSQSQKFRTVQLLGRAGAAILPVAILLPLSLLVIWGIVAMVTRAVREISQSAARQDEHSIQELPLDRVPLEIRPLVESFNSLLSRLRDAFGAQRRFMQDAAHELRTPMAAIGLQLVNLRAQLAGSPTDARCDAQFEQLEAGIQRAQRLVDQMLRLSRQEAQAAQPEAVDLRQQARESINTLIALADRRGIDLGLVDELPPAVKAQVCFAPQDLRSILDNLIDNALRHAPEGSAVDVLLAQRDGRIVIEVGDHGPGVPPEMLERVFDRFFRVPGNDTRGSGLGLAIALAAARRNKAELLLANRADGTGLIAQLKLAAS
jgi:two-component system OmpR family sensor kinase